MTFLHGLNPGIAIGGLCALGILAFSLWKKREFDLLVIGPVAAAFITGSNLVPTFKVFLFCLRNDAIDKLPPELQADAKYLAMPGLCSCLVSLVALWTSFKMVAAEADQQKLV